LASAIQLTAINTINSGYGLAPNTAVLSQIQQYQQQIPVNLFDTASVITLGTSDTTRSNIVNLISNIASGVTKGQWLLDLYPANITPVSSAGVSYNFGSVPSFANTVQSQVMVPFSSGMSGFANVYSFSFAYVATSFDTVASANILQGKTYAQSGLGYAGPLDLATGGIGKSSSVLANVVSKFGTMYDINNISTIGDLYVFGQNLLNQNLGGYGNLADQLVANGLDITNLQAIPQSTTTTSLQSVTSSTNTPIGAVNIPTLATTTATTTVSGNSADVVNAIYESVTGSNLAIIANTTGVTTFVGSSITNLLDYLNLTKIVDSANLAQLNSFGITTLTGLGNYIHSKLGKGNFNTWKDMSTLLISLEVPALKNTTANANTPILANSIVSSITTGSGGGSGPLGNPIFTDLLGAVTGYPYRNELAIINANYFEVAISINLPTLMQTLKNAVNTYASSPNSSNYTALSTAVSNVNSALRSLSSSSDAGLARAQTAYYQILNKITTEVGFLNKAGVTFGAGSTNVLNSFAQGLPTSAADKTQYNTYQFFGNLVTNDSYGDTIQAAVAENINTQLMNSVGITLNNDPAPAQAIVQAQAQNVPLTTYLSQNQ
jgi:hypothetical protein